MYNPMTAIEIITRLQNVFNPQGADKIKIERILNDPNISEAFYNQVDELNNTRRKTLEDKHGFLYFKLRPAESNNILKTAFFETLSAFCL
jgi:hypothetical protein